jgi:hypothetical protein
MQKSKVQIHNGKFTRQKFHTAFFQGKTSRQNSQGKILLWKINSWKTPKAKFCSADFCPRGARVSSRRKPRKPLITSALCALVTACGACLTQFLFSELLFHFCCPLQKYVDLGFCQVADNKRIARLRKSIFDFSIYVSCCISVF